MGKRKSKKSGGRRKGSRMSGVKGADLMEVGINLILGSFGAVGVQFAAEKLDKTKNPATPVDLSPTLVGSLSVGAGLVLQLTKNKFARAFGNGLAIGGAVTLGKSFGILSGIGDGTAPIIFERPPGRIAGLNKNMSVLSGMDNGSSYPEGSRLNGLGDPEMAVISGNSMDDGYMGGGYDSFSTY